MKEFEGISTYTLIKRLINLEIIGERTPELIKLLNGTIDRLNSDSYIKAQDKILKNQYITYYHFDIYPLIINTIDGENYTLRIGISYANDYDAYFEELK